MCFALYKIQNGQLILHRKSFWQAGAPFAARQLVEDPEKKTMPFLRERSQIQAEQLLAEACVFFPDKGLVQNLRAPFFKTVQNRLGLLPVREANGVFPLDERKIGDAAVIHRKQQAGLPEFAVAVIKQEISLSVDDRAVLIVLLAADAVAVLAYDEICAGADEFAADFLEVRRRVAVVLLSAVIQHDQIVAVLTQAGNVVEAFQRVKGICAGRVWRSNGKLMLRAAVDPDFLISDLPDIRLAGVGSGMACASVRDTGGIQRLHRGRESLRALIKNVVISQRQKMNRHLLIGRYGLGSGNQTRAALRNRRGAVCQRHLEIKNIQVGLPQQLRKLTAE